MLTEFYEKIIDLNNLEIAWSKVCYFVFTERLYETGSYKAFDYQSKKYMAELNQYLQQVPDKLESLRYFEAILLGKFRNYYIPSPSYSLIAQAITNLIGPEFENTFVHQSIGYRLNITDQAFRVYGRTRRTLEYISPYLVWSDQIGQLANNLKQWENGPKNYWYLITDIERFFPSISIDRLLGLFATKIKDQRAFRLLHALLTPDIVDPVGRINKLRGLPMGLICSPFFANVYLNEMDHIAVMESVQYLRYVDDICLLFESKQHLDKFWIELQKYLFSIGLKTNMEKTFAAPLANFTNMENFIANLSAQRYSKEALYWGEYPTQSQGDKWSDLN